MISVIIPAYNSAQYIRATLNSVLNQTVTDLEVIVVDDGSTDGTARIVREFSDPRLTLLEQPHEGVSAARNRGLTVASGEYVAFLDADDLWRPDALRHSVTLLESDPELVCSFSNFVRFVSETEDILGDQFRFFRELDRLPVEPIAKGQGFIIVADAFESLVQFGEFPAFMLVMLFRRDRIRGLEFNRSLRRCQDADFVLRAFMRGPVAFSPRVIADVRRHGANATANVAMMPVDKLKALESVGRSVVEPKHRRAYDLRMIRACFDAAGAHLRHGDAAAAARYWLQGMRQDGGALRKVRGSIRLAAIALARKLFFRASDVSGQ